MTQRRCRHIFRHQRDRAKKVGAALDYDLAALRNHVREALKSACPYCGEAMRPTSFGLDHGTPTSRGGAHSRSNLVVCCKACNERKGALTEDEFRLLLMCLGALPDEARRDVLARLRAGGRRMRG
jgi:5-methylcytosine-specific restriction endonuclease McrA